MIKKKTKEGKIKHTVIVYDGIQFQSILEKTMYRHLQLANIKAKYEEEVFILTEDIHLPNDCYERHMNGKGEFTNRKNTRINKMFYTPDFTGRDFIIEVKGKANERFPITWKLFKHHLIKVNDTRMLFKPQSLKDCIEVVRLIKQKRIDDTKKLT